MEPKNSTATPTENVFTTYRYGLYTVLRSTLYAIIARVFNNWNLPYSVLDLTRKY